MLQRESDDQEWVEDPQAQHRAEQSFYHSLCYLADLYAFDADAMLTDDLFPLWIATTSDNVQHWFDSSKHKGIVVILTEVDNCPVLTTCVSEHTGTYEVHWLAVEPYWLLLERKHNCAPLVGAMYSYLWKKAGVDYFLEADGSFMAGEYETTLDMLKDDLDQVDECLKSKPDDADLLEERESYQDRVDDLNSILEKAEICRKTLMRPVVMNTFGRLIDRFKPANQNEIDLHKIAQRFRDFFTKFPDTSLVEFDNYQMIGDQEEEIEIEECDRVCIAMHTSFIWDYDDPGAETADQTLRHHYECGGTCILPRQIQVFDRPHQTVQLDTSFIKELYPLLEDFNTALHKITTPLYHEPLLAHLLDDND